MCPKKSYNEIKLYIENNGETLLSTEYIKNNEKLEIICSTCHNPYKICWRDYRRNHRCSECFGSKKKTYEEVKNYIENNGDILISTEYINVFSKLEIECGTCKNIFMMNFNTYQAGIRCWTCRNKKIGDGFRLSQEHVEEYIKSCGDELLSKYHTSFTKLQIKCGICKNTYVMSFNNFFSKKRRCRCDKNPIGERTIEKYLRDHNINFETQKTITGCKYKKLLLFDFYLPYYNLLIEFDGKQHMEPLKCFGGVKEFEQVQKRDLIKNVFCIKNKHHLLRIPYTDMNKINTILDNIYKMKLPKM